MTNKEMKLVDQSTRVSNGNLEDAYRRGFSHGIASVQYLMEGGFFRDEPDPVVYDPEIAIKIANEMRHDPDPIECEYLHTFLEKCFRRMKSQVRKVK